MARLLLSPQWATADFSWWLSRRDQERAQSSHTPPPAPPESGRCLLLSPQVSRVVDLEQLSTSGGRVLSGALRLDATALLSGLATPRPHARDVVEAMCRAAQREGARLTALLRALSEVERRQCVAEWTRRFAAASPWSQLIAAGAAAACDELIEPGLLLASLSAVVERLLGDSLAATCAAQQRKPVEEVACPLMLKDILAADELGEALPSPLLAMLHALVGPPTGLNLRNLAWHGFLPLCEPLELLSPYVTLMLFVALEVAGHVAALPPALRRPLRTRDAMAARDAPLLSHWDAVRRASPHAATWEWISRGGECDPALAAAAEAIVCNSMLMLPGRERDWREALRCALGRAPPTAAMAHRAMALAIPTLEFGLRRAYVVVNSLPEAMLTAESEALYTTLDAILAPTLPESEDPNRLMDLLGTGLAAALSDVFMARQGPRLRDRVAHAELPPDGYEPRWAREVALLCTAVASRLVRAECSARAAATLAPTLSFYAEYSPLLTAPAQFAQSAHAAWRAVATLEGWREVAEAGASGDEGGEDEAELDVVESLSQRVSIRALATRLEALLDSIVRALGPVPGHAGTAFAAHWFEAARRPPLNEVHESPVLARLGDTADAVSEVSLALLAQLEALAVEMRGPKRPSSRRRLAFGQLARARRVWVAGLRCVCAATVHWARAEGDERCANRLFVAVQRVATAVRANRRLDALSLLSRAAEPLGDDLRLHAMAAPAPAAAAAAAAAASPALPVYGEHTLVPELLRHPEVVAGTLLEASRGRLPPYIIVVGDRRRVQSQHPPLDKALFLHDEMRRRGLTPGRVSVAVGTFDGAPLAVVEHGMGCPSTEVILREILSDRHCARRFPVPGAADEVFDAPAKFVIRVGTAAGLNRREPRADGSTLREFDLIVCNEQVGISLTDAQALTGHLNLFDPRLLAETRSALVQLGYGFRRLAGAEAPTLATDAELAEALERGAEAGIARFLPAARAVRLGNFSKDSLYAEKHEAEFVALREECGVGSSEMEFSTVARVAQQHTRAGDPVRCGMVAAVLGLIPGDGFSEDHERAAAASSAAMFAAMSALAHVAKQHRRPARP